MLRRKRPPEKHVAYFALVEACRSADCPICRLVTQRVAKYFETLLFEGICNEDFINQFRAAYGFCNHHAHQFAASNDGLAIALTHRDLLAVTLAGVRAKGLRYLAKQATQACLICDIAREEETRHLTVFLDFFPDPEFKMLVLASAGLCVPHYRTLLARRKTIPAWFQDFQMEAYTTLMRQLDRYLESCNFSSGAPQPPLTEAESLAWQKAVRLLFGHAGQR